MPSGGCEQPTGPADGAAAASAAAASTADQATAEGRAGVGHNQAAGKAPLPAGARRERLAKEAVPMPAAGAWVSLVAAGSCTRLLLGMWGGGACATPVLV